MDWFKNLKRREQLGILKGIQRKVSHRLIKISGAYKYDNIEDHELEIIDSIISSLINQVDPYTSLNISRQEPFCLFADTSKGDVDKMACIAVHILTEVKKLSNTQAYELIVTSSNIPKTAKSFGDCHKIPKYNKGKKEILAMFSHDESEVLRNTFLGINNSNLAKENHDIKIYKEVVREYEKQLIQVDINEKADTLACVLNTLKPPIERTSSSSIKKQIIGKLLNDVKPSNDSILDYCFHYLSEFYNKNINGKIKTLDFRN